MRKYLLIGASAFVLGAGSMAYVSQQAVASAQPRAQTYKMLELFGDVLDTVERQYVTEVDDKKPVSYTHLDVYKRQEVNTGWIP